MPKFKAIHAQKLYCLDVDMQDSNSNLQPVLKRFTGNSGYPNYWELSALRKAGFLPTVITQEFET